MCAGSRKGGEPLTRTTETRRGYRQNTHTTTHTHIHTRKQTGTTPGHTVHGLILAGATKLLTFDAVSRAETPLPFGETARADLLAVIRLAYSRSLETKHAGIAPKSIFRGKGGTRSKETQGEIITPYFFVLL